jgi:CelD/BcsL family acetyltransferase involved in cellulose biosynthesis
VKIRVINSLREFDTLAPAWREVTRAGGQESPFLSHDWFACCWRTAGPNRRREVWVVEDTTGPLAFIPLVRQHARVRGLPVRVLGFLESPDTPFTDVPVAGELEAVMGTFLTSLRDRRDWDLFTAAKLPTGSPTLKGLQAAVAGQFPWREGGTMHSPYVTVSGDWEAFFRQKTQRFRKTCRNIENRVHRAGNVSVEEHREVDPDGTVFAELMETSLQSWKGPRGLAMATMDGMPRFFRELTGRASANGWLHVWILRLDGRAVATEYQLRAGGQVHALRADFDATLADISPGAYLNQHIVRALFQRGGVDEYDMGLGTNEYKLRWASGAREVATVDVYAPTVYGRALHRVETRLVPLARRCRAWMRERTA